MDSERLKWKFTNDGAFVERECLLFEAGEYPDRGVTITPADLLAIAKNSPESIPVRVEHLARSPFDGALGAVMRLRAVGNRLWGTLRQPAEAWQFVQRAGAKALSVAIDTGATKGWRLAEVSFVCLPRVASAQVFNDNGNDNANLGAQPSCRALFHSSPLFGQGETETEEERDMVSVRQFADGLMLYVRSMLGAEAGNTEEFSRALSAERTQLSTERDMLQSERVGQKIEEMKRRGLIRATDETQELAKSLLLFGVTNVVQFNNEPVSIDRLFMRFLEANGPVVPMGEVAAAVPEMHGASDRLIALAGEASRRDGLPYVTAFSRVSAAHPELARAAREESING